MEEELRIKLFGRGAEAFHGWGEGASGLSRQGLSNRVDMKCALEERSTTVCPSPSLLIALQVYYAGLVTATSAPFRWRLDLRTFPLDGKHFRLVASSKLQQKVHGLQHELRWQSGYPGAKPPWGEEGNKLLRHRWTKAVKGYENAVVVGQMEV